MYSIQKSGSCEQEENCSRRFSNPKYRVNLNPKYLGIRVLCGWVGGWGGGVLAARERWEGSLKD
jgi:hypothetical protein